MPEQEYIYEDRIVAFIDVLGFQEKLIEFESDAKTKELVEGTEFLVSDKVNEFINTFKSVVSLLDEDNLRYYLFSDNICITVDHIENPELIVSLLFTINQLFYSFAQKGYFLRGGIDVGKFIDEKRIALGIPLANAYKLESNYAVYPRILISDKYNTLINDYLRQKENKKFENLDSHELIYDSCELHYLNVFYYVVFKEDKAAFFNTFREKILENMQLNTRREKVYEKYKWLAEQYNLFLEKYYTVLIFKEDDEPPPELIDQLKTLKI